MKSKFAMIAATALLISAPSFAQMGEADPVTESQSGDAAKTPTETMKPENSTQSKANNTGPMQNRVDDAEDDMMTEDMMMDDGMAEDGMMPPPTNRTTMPPAGSSMTAPQPRTAPAPSQASPQAPMQEYPVCTAQRTDSCINPGAR